MSFYKKDLSKPYWIMSFPMQCECGANIQTTSYYRHVQSKKHIMEMEKPENKDKKPSFDSKCKTPDGQWCACMYCQNKRNMNETFKSQEICTTPDGKWCGCIYCKTKKSRN